MGKVENVGYQHFLLFPKMFCTQPKTNFNFSVTFILSSASAFKLDQSRNLSFGKELTDNMRWGRRNRSRLEYFNQSTFCEKFGSEHTLIILPQTNVLGVLGGILESTSLSICPCVHLCTKY